MSEKPMRLFIVDAISRTQSLGAAESGAFFLLLMDRALSGRLATNENEIAQITKQTVGQWRKMASAVLALFGPDRRGDVPADLMVGIGRRDWRDAIPLSLRAEVLNRDGFACVYCGSGDEPLHLDHRHPWSRGGKNTLENLCAACKPCNLSKGSLTPEEWLG